MQLSMVMLQALGGMCFFVFLAFCFSEKRQAINWKLIISALVLQNLLFLLIQHVPFVNNMLGGISHVLLALLASANEGAKFAFGDFTMTSKYGFVFSLFVVPTLIFFGALIGALYFFQVIQFVIQILARLLQKTVKLSGAESLIVIADIFLGQTEGPLLIGPYINTMTRSELALAFTAGLANISGSTLGMYLGFLSAGDSLEALRYSNYLITAGVMNAVSAIIFAKLLFPEIDFANVSSEKVKVHAHFTANFIDSVFQGALTGLKIAVTMIAVLIAVISLVHVLDVILAKFGEIIHINNLIFNSTNGVFTAFSLEYILGELFRVCAFFMGIPWGETLNIGSLLGQKVVLNEFIAYMHLGEMKSAHVLSKQAIFVATFALASFSNFSSIGISLGVFSVLAPTRRVELTQIAWRALFGAVMAGFMTATIAGFWNGIIG